MRVNAMTYPYLTSVFFTSLERGAQREKKSEESEQGRGGESERKVWSCVSETKQHRRRTKKKKEREKDDNNKEEEEKDTDWSLGGQTAD